MPLRRKSPLLLVLCKGLNPSRGSALFALFFLLAMLGAMLGALTGCSRLHGHDTTEKVYVLPKEKFLKDRVAVLANTTAKVTNGEPLEVIERSRRFIHVKTPKGETGWIEEATVASQHTVDQFDSLASANKSDMAVAMATASSESRMHILPGRSEPWLYLVQSGDKLHLLKRAIAPKAISQAPTAYAGKAGSESGAGKVAAVPEIPMEDWWLARDDKGHTGWLLGRSLDVDVPDAMLKLGQGERFMGVYPLDTVQDEDSGMGPTVTEYAVAYAPNHGGLLFDFDEVVVYTWNTRKHRYEGAYRDKNIEGFLPMTVTHEIPPVTGHQKTLPPEPVFRYKVLAAGADITLPQPPDPLPDPKRPADSSDKGVPHPEVGVPHPEMGIPHPGQLLEKAYRLEINHVAVVGTTVKPSEEAHAVAEKKIEKEKKKKRK